MTQLVSISDPVLKLKEAIAAQDYVSSLKILQQLPLRNRWDTFFLVQRAFSNDRNRDYVRALAHDLLYRAHREELAQNLSEASRLYRLLIQHATTKRIIQKSREGYLRISQGAPLIQAQHDSAAVPPVVDNSDAPTASIADDEPSLILIEPIASEQKQALALEFAKILETDPYTARLALPSLEFRMMRHGQARHMQTLHESLNTADIPNRHVALSSIQNVPVHDVLYIDSIGDRLIVQVRDPDQQSIPMTVAWSDVQQRVDGLLPLFEEVIARNKKGKITRKTETQDHAQICDLHLGHHQGILRFYDAGYQFNQGMPLVRAETPRMALETKTSWAQWQGLKQILAEHLPDIPQQLKFEHFANSAVEQIEMLTGLNARIEILRRHECYWDQAFHLYSSLHYLRLG